MPQIDSFLIVNLFFIYNFFFFFFVVFFYLILNFFNNNKIKSKNFLLVFLTTCLQVTFIKFKKGNVIKAFKSFH